jgi:hypothetical protein
MAFSYVICTTNRLATGTFSGSVSGAEIAVAFRTVYDDPAWRPGFDTIWEANGITELLIERRDLADLVAMHRELAAVAGTGYEIIVVNRNVDQIMARIYTFMMRNQARQTRMCGSMVEAAQILGRAT